MHPWDTELLCLYSNYRIVFQNRFQTNSITCMYITLFNINTNTTLCYNTTNYSNHPWLGIYSVTALGDFRKLDLLSYLKVNPTITTSKLKQLEYMWRRFQSFQKCALLSITLKWTAECKNAVKRMNDTLTSSEALLHYNPLQMPYPWAVVLCFNIAS